MTPAAAAQVLYLEDNDIAYFSSDGRLELLRGASRKATDTDAARRCFCNERLVSSSPNRSCRSVKSLDFTLDAISKRDFPVRWMMAMTMRDDERR